MSPEFRQLVRQCITPAARRCISGPRTRALKLTKVISAAGRAGYPGVIARKPIMMVSAPLRGLTRRRFVLLKAFYFDVKANASNLARLEEHFTSDDEAIQHSRDPAARFRQQPTGPCDLGPRKIRPRDT